MPVSQWQTLAPKLTQQYPKALSFTREVKLKRKEFSLEKQYTWNKEIMEDQKNKESSEYFLF